MTTPSVPDACSLSQPEFADRLAWIRSEIPRARRARRTPDGAVWEFDPDPALRERLARLVALEAECCDPEAIRFRLAEEEDALRLEVQGIDPSSPLLEDLAPAGRGWKRLAKAGGAGAVGAFALLCGLPMAIVAVAGSAAAAPLLGLESPTTLAAGTLLIGGLVWWRLGRKVRG